MTPADDLAPATYVQLPEDVKARIRDARVTAALAVNHALIVLYWQIGTEILRRENEQGWGARVIERLASDLRREFPGMTGLSRRNLGYMRAFAAAWPASGNAGTPCATTRCTIAMGTEHQPADQARRPQRPGLVRAAVR